jgi:hypothetical protein
LSGDPDENRSASVAFAHKSPVETAKTIVSSVAFAANVVQKAPA